MRERVPFIRTNLILTIFTIIMLVALLFYVSDLLQRVILGVVLVGILSFGFYFMPLSIAADEEAIYIHRFFRTKIIRMSNVQSVQLCPSSNYYKKVCGSGGFFGNWGWFVHKDYGKFFAYYGSPDECFLVELRNGRKYMLGCNNSPKMVEYINTIIKKPRRY